jgi:hypothetical protein
MQPSNNITIKISDPELTLVGDVLVISRTVNEYDADEAKSAHAFVDFFTELRTRDGHWIRIETGCWLDADNLPQNVGIQLGMHEGG